MLGIIVLQRLIDLGQVVWQSGQYAGVTEGTSALLLQSGHDESWRADSMKCDCYLRNVQDPFVGR